MTVTEVENYQDIKEEWLKEVNPNSHRVRERNYFETIDGIKYYVDGRNVVLDYSEKEREVAEWLEDNFGGQIYMLPRINKPDGIQTADYLFRGEYWDLKEVHSGKNRAIDYAIKKHRRQACNFILDVINSPLSIQQSKLQAKRIYSTAGREWVNMIMLKKGNRLIAIYRRNNCMYKKRLTPTPTRQDQSQ